MKFSVHCVLIGALLFNLYAPISPEQLPERSRQIQSRPLLFSFRPNAPSYHQIHRIDSAGSNLKILTSFVGNADHPNWSPDGQQIAFDLDVETPESAVYVMNADGSQQKRISNEKIDSNQPIWSPDGKKIVMTCRPDQYQICIVDADGSNFKILTSPTEDAAPAWSWDSKKIVFLSWNGSADQIYTMNADGSERTKLTTMDGDKSLPIWSPDGKSIVFRYAKMKTLLFTW